MPGIAAARDGSGQGIRLERSRLVPWLRRGLAICGMVLVVPGACTFEKRSENANDVEVAEAQEAEVEGAEDRPPAVRDPEDAAMGALRAFHEAVAVGDLSLALTLLDREATVLDDLVGEWEETASRGEILLELRRVLARGLEVDEHSHQISFPGEIAVVVSQLVLRSSDEDSPESVQEMDGRRLHETVILVPTDDGWRIRHLHRSLVPRVP